MNEQKRATPAGADIVPPSSPASPAEKRLGRMGWRRWLYLPRLFTRREKIKLALLSLVAVITFAALASRLVIRFTVIRPAVGGVLREGSLVEPRFINPLYALGDTDRDLANLAFSKLISYGRDGSAVMDLAERIEISPDGKAYTVVLRQGVWWHDGEKFSPDDVIFTIKAIQHPDYNSPLRQNWQGVGLEKLDDRTVRFTLRQPYAPFLENLAVGILPEHLWRRIPREAASLSDLNLKPIGTGPYQFKKFTRREDGTITSVVLERNRRYHLAGPYLKEISFHFFPTEEKLINAYRRNEIDSFLLPSREPLTELAAPDVTLHELKLSKIFAVFLNANVQPALGRHAVRQALAAAIDRPALLQALMSGGTVVNSAIPSGTFGFNGEVAAVAYEPETARKLLAEDGWKDADQDGVLERSEGGRQKRTIQKLEIKLVTSDAPELAEVARRIGEMWRAVGVKTEVKTLAVSELESSFIRPRAYEALLFGEVFGHDPDPFAFWHTSQLKDPGLNIALYSNRAVDELLEEARRTSDPALRSEKYRQFQKIVSDELGAIFLHSPLRSYAIRKGFRGVAIGAVTLPEERFNAVNQWHVDTRRALE